MLHIILLIFKIIGVVLLCLLGLLLLVTALILLVPVRYHAKGEKYQQLHVRGSVSWLLHLVHLSADYQGQEPLLILRILGIPLWRSDREDTKPAKSERKKAENRKKKAGERKEPEQDEKTPPDPQGAEAQKKPPDPSGPDSVRKLPAGEKGKEQKTSLWEKTKAFFQKIRNAVLRFWNQLKEFRDSAVRIRDRISRYLEWLRMEETALAFRTGKQSVGKLLRHIAPGKFDVYLRIGTGDPASTGQLLGAAALFYPATKGQLRITPEFQEKILEGRFSLKGRIVCLCLLTELWKLYRDQNVRTAYQAWRSL